MTTTLKYFFLLGTFALPFIQACSNKSEAVTINQDLNSTDTLNLGCLGSFDINPSNNKERINQTYGKQHVKDGHWITFGFAASKKIDKKAARVKIEEGYYRKNKKVGYWKTFNDDGTIKDSVAYKNGFPVTSNLKKNTFRDMGKTNLCAQTDPPTAAKGQRYFRMQKQFFNCPSGTFFVLLLLSLF